jgi:2-C-methyl-D-erythritol 4-phosphate cytidylyltransferase/2-C-methyl-D-erythritol 2,4-cyclodiphosphate synthase
MKTDIPKQFLLLDREPVLLRTVKTFLTQNTIHHVVVATSTEYRQETEQLFLKHLPKDLTRKLIFTNGGATRQDSVYAGLLALPDEVEIVLVHDGARPMIDSDIIARCLQGALQFGAVIAGVAAKDTLKKISSDGSIVQTVDRSDLWHAQTPQAVRKKLLESAYQKAHQDNFTGTDESSLLEHAGIQVHIVQGSEKNIKITRPDDFKLIAGLIEKTKPMKIGHGYDAHQLVKNRKLVLGGVTIPHDFGLLGHSDADVLTHALIDALIGAIGEGDIGRHFPDTDKKLKDISSLYLLKHTISLLSDRNLQIGNADLTVICQKPKLAAFIDEMRSNLAATCKSEPQSINIKATTTERMGFTGRGEGISAHAVVLLMEKQ